MLRYSCVGLIVTVLGVTAPAWAQSGSTTATAAARTESESVVPPRLEYQPRLEYPEAARGEGIEGLVRLELLLSETGTVAEILAVRGPEVLKASAVAAAKQLRFTPALVNGEPVPVQVPYTFRFVAPVAEASPEAPAAPPAEVEAPLIRAHPSGTVIRSPTATSARARDVMVLTRRAARSATDFRIRLDLDNLSAPPGTSGAAVLRSAPGVYISQHSGQGKGHQIFLRGFDAVHGQDVAVSAAGIPVNDVSNIHAQGYVDLHFLIPEVISQMRVLEGPFDPAQGDFAVAGSIEFDLGLPKTGVWARISAGQYGLLRGLVAWRPQEASEDTFVAAEVAQGDGFGPARSWGRANVMGQWGFDLGDDVQGRILASTYAGRFDSAGALRLDDFEAGRFGFYDTFDPLQGGASSRHQVRLALERETDDTRTEASVYGVVRGFRLRSNFTGFLLDDRNGDRFEQEQGAVIIGGKAEHRMRLHDRIQLGVGVQVRHDEIDQSQRRLQAASNAPAIDQGGDEDNNRLGITDIGVYGDLDIALLSWLSARGGLRVEALSYRIDERRANDGDGERREAFGYHLAPRVTLDGRLTDAFRVFASYGNGFRSPQAVSLQQGEQTPLTVVQAFELGTRINALRGLEVVAAGFFTRVEEDLIFDHATGQQIFTGPTDRLGGIARAELVLAMGLHASASVTYTRATKPDEDDVQVPFVPPLVIQGDIHYDADLGRIMGKTLGLSARLSGVGLGERPLPFSETGQAVFLLEGAVGLHWSGIGLSVEAFNLTDSEWRDSEFVYSSNPLRPSPSGLPSNSDVPARHFTAGQPFTLQTTLSLEL